jgi:ribosomal protein S8
MSCSTAGKYHFTAYHRTDQICDAVLETVKNSGFANLFCVFRFEEEGQQTSRTLEYKILDSHSITEIETIVSEPSRFVHRQGQVFEICTAVNRIKNLAAYISVSALDALLPITLTLDLLNESLAVTHEVYKMADDKS